MAVQPGYGNPPLPHQPMQQQPMQQQPMQPMHQPIQQPMQQHMQIQQPQGTQVVVQQPRGDVKIVSSKEGHRTWSTDMFDCFDQNTSCLFTWLCPWFTMAEVSRRMNENFMVACCVPGGMVALRARLRTLGGIKGSICGDYLSLCFCCVCGLSQMERELHHMGI